MNTTEIIIFTLLGSAYLFILYSEYVQTKRLNKTIEQFGKELNPIKKEIDSISLQLKNLKFDTTSELNKAQEHLAKTRDQLLIHQKYLKALKRNQIQRLEVVVKPNHEKTLTKIKDQLKDL